MVAKVYTKFSDEKSQTSHNSDPKSEKMHWFFLLLCGVKMCQPKTVPKICVRFKKIIYFFDSKFKQSISLGTFCAGNRVYWFIVPI